jgi:hypothetical protein
MGLLVVINLARWACRDFKNIVSQKMVDVQMSNTYRDSYRGAGTNKGQPSEFNSSRNVPDSVSKHRKIGFERFHHEVRMLDGKAHYDIEP